MLERPVDAERRLGLPTCWTLYGAQDVGDADREDAAVAQVAGLPQWARRSRALAGTAARSSGWRTRSSGLLGARKGASVEGRRGYRRPITINTMQRQRRDLHHRSALALIRAAHGVSLEALRVANPVCSRHLSKPISDAGWARFRVTLQARVACAERRLVMEPDYTSQDCSGCGGARRRRSVGGGPHVPPPPPAWGGAGRATRRPLC